MSEEIKREYDLVFGEVYTIPNDTYTTHSGKTYDTHYEDITCGNCGNDTFKMKRIDRSCPGCGHGGYVVNICVKCGVWND